jgi:hypothetical protein
MLRRVRALVVSVLRWVRALVVSVLRWVRALVVVSVLRWVRALVVVVWVKRFVRNKRLYRLTQDCGILMIFMSLCSSRQFGFGFHFGSLL